MTRSLCTAACALLGILLWIAPGATRAQVQAQDATPTTPVDPDLEALTSAYEFGRYEDVLQRARARLDRGGLQTEQLITLHRFAGLSAFNLGKEEDARRHFTALLRLQPDFGLDPFSVSPPAITFFENLRKQLDPQLEVIRQQQRVEAERRAQQEADRLRRQREEEERRRRMEELSRRVTVRNVEQKAFLVNFVPFGAGQFQQDRTAAGVVLAAAQGATAITSIIAYFAINGMIERHPVKIRTPEGIRTEYIRGVPAARVAERDTWRIVKYASAGAFYTLYGYGVVDAIYHHEDEVVTTTTLQLPPDISPRIPPRVEPAEPAPGAPKPPPASPEDDDDGDTVPVGPGVTGEADTGAAPSPPSLRTRAQAGGVSAQYFLFPTSSGLGAGMTLRF